MIGVDNLNAYYDVRLKQARLERLEGRPGFTFYRAGRVGSGSHRRSGGGTTKTSASLFIWPRKPGCDIRWSIPMPMCRRT